MKTIPTILVASLLAAATGASGHGDEAHARKSAKKPISTEQHAWGREGDPAKASRTILVDMNDTMRFKPGEMRIRRGETVKFIVTNSGKVMHEMVIGTEAELKAHAEIMKKHPGMEHEEPYMAHVPPGKTGEIVWTFNRAGEFEFACLIAGHYQAGMFGTITVRTA